MSGHTDLTKPTTFTKEMLLDWQRKTISAVFVTVDADDFRLILDLAKEGIPEPTTPQPRLIEHDGLSFRVSDDGLKLIVCQPNDAPVLDVALTPQFAAALCSMVKGRI